MTPHHDPRIEALRGYGLTALYASLGLLALMLVFAAFRLWPAAHSSDANIEVVVLVLAGGATALASGRTTILYWRGLRAKPPACPPLKLAPFYLMAFTLLIASVYFTGF